MISWTEMFGKLGFEMYKEQYIIANKNYLGE
jgi:hypothetical protein